VYLIIGGETAGYPLEIRTLSNPGTSLNPPMKKKTCLKKVSRWSGNPIDKYGTAAILK
jgi:hypothetical protein